MVDIYEVLTCFHHNKKLNNFFGEILQQKKKQLLQHCGNNYTIKTHILQHWNSIESNWQRQQSWQQQQSCRSRETERGGERALYSLTFVDSDKRLVAAAKRNRRKVMVQ